MARPKTKKKAADADDSVQIVDQEVPNVRTSPRKRKPLTKVADSDPVKTENLKVRKTRRTKRSASPQPTLVQRSISRASSTGSDDNTLALLKSFRESSKAHSPEAEIPKTTTNIKAEDILRAGNDDILKFINTLVNTSQHEAIEKYKQTCKLQMANDAKLISQLQAELETKQKSIDTLAFQLQRYQNFPATPQKRQTAELYQLPIRNGSSSSSLMIHHDELAQELKTIGITLDMLELLTGVRIINYEEDREKFYFDVKQSSTNTDNDNEAITVEYRLVIKKDFEESADVNYVPVFLSEADNESTERLISHLPDYLRDNLIFPYNTLSQFYAKMNKALNKARKS